MQTTADVVIIGGGIAGASTFYHLTKNGIQNVLLIEQDRLGSGTTAYTAAWVRLQKPSELGIRMSQISFDEFRLFNDEHNIGFHVKGSLSVNTVEHLDSEYKRAKLQESLGVPTQILTPEEIKSVAPILNVQDIGIGRFCSEDGVIDAQALLRAYVKKARLLGAKIEEGVKATNIIIKHSKVVGVETTLGFISTPFVVNAAGIYAKQVGNWVGLDIPIRKHLGHIVLTEPISSIPEDMPLLEILNPELIFIGSTGKQVDYTVGDLYTDSFEHKPNLDLILEKHLEDLLYRVPEIANAGVVKCIAGIRANTLDGLPILGPVKKIPGYINSCGFGGNGIMHAPVAGELIARHIAGIKEYTIGIEPFLLERFG